MPKALVSVVMCTYNGSKFLDKQIETILEQDYPNIELIISDDRSTDDTWEKLTMWQQKSPLIKIYRNDCNLGYSKNFEKAIQLANGDFIALSDQDDIWMTHKITRLISEFKNDDVILAHGRSVRYEKGRLRFKSASLHHPFNGNDTRRLFMFNQLNGHGMMFRKKLVSKVVPIPSGMMYDWWIAVVATCYGKVVSVNDILVYHRIHGENSFFNSRSTVKKSQLDLPETLQLFTGIKELSSSSRAFLNEFLQLLKDHYKVKGFDRELFKFLYKNGEIIFGHKRRLLQKINFLKNAFKYARFDFRGKGVV